MSLLGELIQANQNDRTRFDQSIQNLSGTLKQNQINQLAMDFINAGDFSKEGFMRWVQTHPDIDPQTALGIAESAKKLRELGPTFGEFGPVPGVPGASAQKEIYSGEYKNLQKPNEPKFDTIDFFDNNGNKQSVRIPETQYNTFVKKIGESGGTLDAPKTETRFGVDKSGRQYSYQVRVQGGNEMPIGGTRKSLNEFTAMDADKRIIDLENLKAKINANSEANAPLGLTPEDSEALSGLNINIGGGAKISKEHAASLTRQIDSAQNYLRQFASPDLRTGTTQAGDQPLASPASWIKNAINEGQSMKSKSGAAPAQTQAKPMGQPSPARSQPAQSQSGGGITLSPKSQRKINAIESMLRGRTAPKPDTTVESDEDITVLGTSKGFKIGRQKNGGIVMEKFGGWVYPSDTDYSAFVEPFVKTNPDMFR